eukprot:tig00000718_g3684.t1
MAVLAAGFRMTAHDASNAHEAQDPAMQHLNLQLAMGQQVLVAKTRVQPRTSQAGPAFPRVGSLGALPHTDGARGPGRPPGHSPNGPLNASPGLAPQAAPAGNHDRKPAVRIASSQSIHSQGNSRVIGEEEDEDFIPPPPKAFDAPIAMSREEMARLGIRTDTLSESQLNMRLKTQGDYQFWFSILSLIIMVVQKEISFNNREPAIHTDILRATISLLSVLLCVSVVRYYNIRVKILVRKNIVPPTAGVFAAGLSFRLGFELMQCLIHNCPYIDRAPPILENVVTLIMFLRMRYFFRFMVMHSKLFTPSGRFIGALTGVHYSDSFVVRTILFNRPWIVMACAYAIMLSTTSYCMYQFERQNAVDTGTEEDNDLMLFRNNIWCAIVTSLTVGYGDMYPRTDLGRLVVLLTAVCGAFLTALSIALIHNSLELNVQQTKVVQFLKKDEYKTRVKLCAVRCMQAAWRLHLARKRGASRRAQRGLEYGMYGHLRRWRQLKQSYQFSSVGLDATYHHQVSVIEAIFTCVRDLIARLEENGILESSDFPIAPLAAEEATLTMRRASSGELHEPDGGRESPHGRRSSQQFQAGSPPSRPLLGPPKASLAASPRLGAANGGATARVVSLPAMPVPLRAAVARVEGQVGELAERLEGVVRILERSTGISMAEVAPARPVSATVKSLAKSIKLLARPKSRVAPSPRPAPDHDVPAPPAPDPDPVPPAPPASGPAAEHVAAASGAGATVTLIGLASSRNPSAGSGLESPDAAGAASDAPTSALVTWVSPGSERGGLGRFGGGGVHAAALHPLVLGAASVPPTSERVTARSLSEGHEEAARAPPAHGPPRLSASSVREDLNLSPPDDDDSVRPAGLAPASLSSLPGPSRARSATSPPPTLHMDPPPLPGDVLPPSEAA